MKTLLFCTSYVQSAEFWHARYRKWIDYHRSIPLQHDAMFLVDDGSPFRVSDPTVVVLSGLPVRLASDKVFLYRFRESIGRQSALRFGGWWRSFLWSWRIAKRFSFSKIVHVESDAFVLSARLVRYVNDLATGWTALWCPRWQFAESAIQVICADQFEMLGTIAKNPRVTEGRAPELMLPFTHVEQGYIGDRFGEFSDVVPADADYAAQVKPAMAVSYRRDDDEDHQ